MEPVLKWLEKAYPNTQTLVRADSGFATPELYDLCDAYDVSFLIRQLYFHLLFSLKPLHIKLNMTSTCIMPLAFQNFFMIQMSR